MKLRKDRVFGVLIIITVIIGTIIYFVNKNNSSKNFVVKTTEEIKHADYIRFGVSNFDTINPILTKNSFIINVNKLIFEPLFEIDKDYRLKNCLGKEVAKTSPNTYIVKVDNSIKWTNGTNFTAKDVKYTINLIQSRENIFSENVKNIESVDVIDDSTVKIILKNEVPFFEYNLTFPIVCKKYYGNEDYFASTKKPIGTGRYKIKSINDNLIILEKNNDYYNPGIVNEKIERINISIYNEFSEVYNSFKMGKIDIISTSNPQYRNYIGTIGYYAKEYCGREYDFLSLNCNDSLLSDLGVRQAINYAIDKDFIISNVYNNEYCKSDYPLDYGNYLFNMQNDGMSYNEEKAKEVLINNGWNFSYNSWRKYGRTLNLTITVNLSNKKRVQAVRIIKDQLEKIGIHCNIREFNDNDYYGCISNKNYQMLFTGIYNGYGPNLEYFYGENNLANYQNNDVKLVMDEIRNITDEKLLKEKYQFLISTTLYDASYIGLYRNKCWLIVNSKMSGNFEPNNYNIFANFETWNRVEY